MTVVTQDVTFRGRDIELSGTIHAPAGASGLPGVVLVHGSGRGFRETTRAEADAFARAGVVALSYDKRPSGYSTTQRDYSLLADDVLAAVDLLRARPETDRARVGVWGFSEGGWVAPLAASRSDDVAFVVTAGASGHSPSRQQSWALETYLRHRGVRGSLVKALSVSWIRHLVAAGLFAEADYDTVSVLRRVNRPVLAVWGRLDRVIPPAESLEMFRDALADAQLRVIDAADHALRRTTDGYDRLPGFAPGYVDLVTSWIKGLPGTATDAADPPPDQPHRSRPLGRLARWESKAVHLGVLCLLGGAFTGTLLNRHHPATARWAAALGLGSVGGSLCYFALLSTTEKPPVGRIVAGQALPWLVLQGGAAATVATTVVALARQSEGCRSALLGLGLGVFVPWAVYWGLLRP